MRSNNNSSSKLPEATLNDYKGLMSHHLLIIQPMHHESLRICINIIYLHTHTHTHTHTHYQSITKKLSNNYHRNWHLTFKLTHKFNFDYLNNLIINGISYYNR